VLGLFFNLEDEGDKFIPKVGSFLTEYTALNPRI
jgi:hypothetical protein